MQRLLTALLVVVLFAGFTAADDAPVRTDLTPQDLVRVRAVTALTTDFTKPEKFEQLPGGAATKCTWCVLWSMARNLPCASFR